MIATACVLQLLAFSLPWVGEQLLGGLEKQARTLEKAKPLPAEGGLDAIVLLGGATESAFEGWRTLPDLNESADRLWVAARLYKQGVAPVVLVSGGGFAGDSRIEPEALAMREVLKEFGVPEHAIVLESESRTTLENALYTKERLQKYSTSTAGDVSVALVTSAFHMKRAFRFFDQPGLNPYPVRADIRVVPESKPLWRWLPNANGLDKSTLALREQMGLLQLFVKEWFE
ncbi:MAG: YdcF family protein [Limnobacter sp.]|nr:YdcF family protein [Limnobacter sp.]